APAEADVRVRDRAAEVSVDDGDQDTAEARLRVLLRHAARPVERRLLRSRAARAAACGYGCNDRGEDECSESSSENGSRVPSGAVVRVRWERKRVITTPSLNSPTRGSGRSPAASASTSSG